MFKTYEHAVLNERLGQQNLQYRLSNISSFSDKLRTLNHQSQLAVRG